ncbi:MAG: choline dehydrogenase-like flavoprotein [Paracoccaceae bacterium]|jgi:choline dehydrogenase-like flavoprotein
MSAGPDIVIIGSGMGGATLAAGLAPSGARIVILERGQHLQASDQTRSGKAIFGDGVFRPNEQWLTPNGAAFNPGNFYYVGGNSKFYGAVLIRYRAEDFSHQQHLGGISPAWPITYAEFEPWYQAAEQMYQVRGTLDEDPTEPVHSGTYPYPPVPDEAPIADIRHRLAQLGLTPSSLPLGVDIAAWAAAGNTNWDGFPGTDPAKKDAESVGLAHALSFANVRLITGAEVQRLQTDVANRITRIDFRQNGELQYLSPKLVVLSAGAVNSAALLLRSANDNNPGGLANSSDKLGRRFMNHNCSAVMALHPLRKNPAIYQKTLQFNNFYLSGGPGDAPLGNVQLLGKITAEILATQVNLPGPVTRWIAARSFDWYAMSEDLPSDDSRVSLRGDQIVLDWKRSNWQAHEALVTKLKSLLRRAGCPIVMSRAFDRKTPSHQCGTAVFGNDPNATVLDLFCRSHDHENLFVVDASFLPTSAAVNPALTIAAQALRVADYIKHKDLIA